MSRASLRFGILRSLPCCLLPTLCQTGLEARRLLWSALPAPPALTHCLGWKVARCECDWVFRWAFFDRGQQSYQDSSLIALHCRLSCLMLLSEYVRHAWKLLPPGRSFSPSWTLHRLCKKHFYFPAGLVNMAWFAFLLRCHLFSLRCAWDLVQISA